MSDAQWRRTMSINLDGVFYITRRAIPVMREGAAIVTVASVAAHQGGSYAHSHYGATKGGVLAYTRGLARDIAPRIRVNAVSPGMVDTPMIARNVERLGDAQIKARVPMGRVAKPSEIASVVAFCAATPRATSPAKPSSSPAVITWVSGFLHGRPLRRQDAGARPRRR